jgi:hypothetical protein
VILQHDLWALFDWAASEDNDGLQKQRRELETRLSEAIRCLALTSEQFRTLPDTYEASVAARAFAPAYDSQNRQQPLLPESELELLNLTLPQFPVGTEVALVRQMLALDTVRKLVPTRLTESVQIRVYHAITPGAKYMNYINGPSSDDQDFFELQMRRQQLFAGQGGGLVAMAPNRNLPRSTLTDLTRSKRAVPSESRASYYNVAPLATPIRAFTPSRATCSGCNDIES